mgnify:FL=1|jgi:hypothetical protein
MRKHTPEMIAAWAKENGLRGFEQYDPNHKENDRKKSFQKKRFNKTVTFKRRGR